MVHTVKVVSIALWDEPKCELAILFFASNNLHNLEGQNF